MVQATSCGIQPDILAISPPCDDKFSSNGASGEESTLFVGRRTLGHPAERHPGPKQCSPQWALESIGMIEEVKLIEDFDYAKQWRAGCGFIMLMATRSYNMELLRTCFSGMKCEAADRFLKKLWLMATRSYNMELLRTCFSGMKCAGCGDMLMATRSYNMELLQTCVRWHELWQTCFILPLQPLPTCVWRRAGKKIKKEPPKKPKKSKVPFQ